MTSIVEGYDQVPDFDNLEDSEYEEEEVCYVTLDLGPLDPSLLPKATSYQLIGLETSQPFLQVGGCVFRGQYENLLGTEILFQESAGTDPESGNHKVVPITTTENRIRFREVRLVPKDNPGMNLQVEGEDDDQAEPSSPTKRNPRTTLGGVSREATTAFLPATRKDAIQGLLKTPRGKRRFKKRPEGYETPEEEKKQKGQSKKRGKGKEKAVEIEGESGSEEAEETGNGNRSDVMEEDQDM
ncbi:hypothetical protein FRB91_011640 [Serendipita sp. 411]|nr:hypothetical protein FRB91_011640 [Serendipita sp. 411]